MTSRGYSLVGLALTLALGACVANTDSDDSTDALVGESPQEIINGTPATAYPEAVLVDILQQGQLSMGCSGTVIAPRVVLTAGHCVADGDGWNITAPYANGQKAHGSSSAVFDWTANNDQVDPNQHDVGLVFLDSDITLSTYPTIATKELPEGSEIVTLGRVRGGQLSHSEVFVSPKGKIRSAKQYGFPYDYAAPMVIERGDSGGPSYSAGTRTIVTVNSTGDSSTMINARVDLVSSWIQQQIASHGGMTPGGGGTTQPPSGGTTQPPSGGTTEPPSGGEDDPSQGGWVPPGSYAPPGVHHCVFVPWRWMYYCW